MKQHKNNLAYLPTYPDVYQEIYYGIKKALAIKGIHREVENINDVRELRFRLVNTSERLRMKILEVNSLMKRVDEAPEKLKQENAFLKKHSREIYERNIRLEKELGRIKKLDMKKMKQFLRIANARLKKVYPNKQQRRGLGC